MKKFLKYFISIIVILFILFSYNIEDKDNKEYNIPVMNEIRNYNDTYNEYTLIFDKENLNLYNLKLKLSLFNSNDNYIKKIYIKYSNRVEEYFKDKEYFSFYGKNLNEKIENLKNEYIEVLRKNNMFSDIENLSLNNIVIEKVEVVSDIKNIETFKYKYPLVNIVRDNN